MDYQLNIYPSSEKELANVKVDHREKQIKVVQNGNLKALYIRKFGDAVRKYNDFALSGKLIKDYYASILSSNIPEVYRLSIIVRYDLAVPNEVQLIQKSFTDFKKKLDEQPYMAICSVFLMSIDEFKELNIFFVPVSSGYKTQLSVRNDIIDVARNLSDTKENWNILKALPVFAEHIETIWKACCDSNIVSHTELKNKAHAGELTDPMALHSIEVGMLKENMNHLQRLTNENQMLEAQVADEKTRIINELRWSKEMAPAILKAEEERVAEIKRKEEEARLAEEARKEAEARAAEERRRAEELRQAEAARLTEQARRNYSLRSMLSQNQNPKTNKINENPFGAFEIMESKSIPKPVETPVVKPVIEEEQAVQAQTTPVEPSITATISNDELKSKINLHRDWMKKYNITQNVSSNGIVKESLSDPDRLILTKQTIVGYVSEEDLLIGAAFRNCVFKDCHLTGDFFACVFEDCSFIDTTINGCTLTRCGVKKIECKENVSLNNITLADCTIVESNLSGAVITAVTSSINSTIANINCSNVKFVGCDFKKNIFKDCDFNNATFETCDVRAAQFENCNTTNLTVSKSLIEISAKTTT